jgi:Glycosyl transferase family 2
VSADYNQGLLVARPAPAADIELTILMPCLDEAATLPACIRKALGFLDRAGVSGEVLVADNGSLDGSPALACRLGAQVIEVAQRGYGNALIAGIGAARGRYVIIGDSDDSYDFSRLDPFLACLRDGDQLVMGNRFAGGIAPGAMPALHRYLGNPVLSSLGRTLFAAPCRDFHCGLRGMEREAILRLGLSAPGMEFASEMVVKAALHGLRIADVPTTLARDGRSRPPHLRSWRDGWRHLRFLLLFSPSALFLYPGVVVFAVGALASLRLLAGPIVVRGVGFDIGMLLYTSAATVIGWQSMIFWCCAKLHGTREGIVRPDPGFERVLARATLERVLLASVAVFAAGLLLAILSVADWQHDGFGAMSASHSMRLVIPAVTMMLLAAQAAYGAMFVALLAIRQPRTIARSAG